MLYGKTDMGAVENDVKELNGDGHFYSVPEHGDQVFLCPPYAGTRLPYREVTLHYVNKTRVVCLAQFGQECPICSANQELYIQKNNPAALAVSKDIYAKKYYVYNVMPSLQMRQTGPGTSVMFYAPPAGTQGQPRIKPWIVGMKLQRAITNIFSMQGDIFDPMNGNLIKLDKIKQGDFSQVQASAYNKARLDDVLLNVLNTQLIDLTKELAPEPIEKLRVLADSKMLQFRSSMVAVPNNYPQPVQYQVPAPQYGPPVQYLPPQFDNAPQPGSTAYQVPAPGVTITSQGAAPMQTPVNIPMNAVPPPVPGGQTLSLLEAHYAAKATNK